jgi:transcription termination factor Rho
MAESGNGSPDDVVFQDEGSFYDPDDRADDQDHGSNESGEPEIAVGPSNHEGRPNDDRQGGDRQGHRRRRRRRRSRRGGTGGGGGRDFQGGGQQHHGHRQRRPAPDQNGQVDGPEREGAPVLGVIEGILELHPKGYGFLRDPKNNYASGKNDPFVPASLIEKYKLREGSLLKGEIVHGNKGQGPRFRSVETIDGRSLEAYAAIRPFDELTAVNPFERIRLETGSTPITMRVMDLLTPLGKGQRALIVAPPRTGKTMLLQEIANSVSVNHPEMHLIVLLIDERPEEVTEMRRRVRGEVIASSMDRDVESHVRISQLIIERGKRIAEAGGQVFILLDSITRTARAFNKWVGNTGRTMSGGLDVKALDIPKKMFGTARRFDEGGSLTVVATALIDTGSRMDEVIFQEFKGTGNMELVLNRQLADRRVWPAIDIGLSGTRREELILSPDELDGIIMLRRSLVSLNPIEAMEQLVKTLGRFPSNKEFLAKIRAIL